MGQESDDIVSLPVPPPPNPAARRSAIDTALRKFDGIEDSPQARGSRKRPGIFDWASSHRRATGGLVTAALIAVIGIPAIQIALRNPPQETASERPGPGLATADVEQLQDNAATEVSEPASDQPAAVPVARSEPVAPPKEAPGLAKEERLGFTGSSPEQKSRAATVSRMISVPSSPVAAAPPPPPPPPPAPSEPEAETSGADSIVVTGSSVPAGNMAKQDGFAESAAARANATATAEAYDEFLSRLQAAMRASDRSAIMKLVGLPLRVTIAGEARVYRSSRDVERDFDRIFTSNVRSAALNLDAGSLANRNSGKLKGSERIWFGCSSSSCPSVGSIRIREVRP